MTRPPLYEDDLTKFNLRLPKPLYEAILRLARKEELSVNQRIVRTLRQVADQPPRAAETESTHSD